MWSIHVVRMFSMRVISLATWVLGLRVIKHGRCLRHVSPLCSPAFLANLLWRTVWHKCIEFHEWIPLKWHEDNITVTHELSTFSCCNFPSQPQPPCVTIIGYISHMGIYMKKGIFFNYPPIAQSIMAMLHRSYHNLLSQFFCLFIHSK